MLLGWATARWASQSVKLAGSRRVLEDTIEALRLKESGTGSTDMADLSVSDAQQLAHSRLSARSRRAAGAVRER